MTVDASQNDAIFDDLEALTIEDPFSTPGERRRSLTPLEAANTLTWVARLSPFFEIEQQVQGVHCSGDKFRMDFLLHPKQEWRSGGHHPIGFEIKRDNGHIKELTQAIGQASDYAHSTFHSKKLDADIKCFVAIYMSYEERGEEASLVDRIAGRLNVAILRETGYKGLILTTSGEVRWSEKWGMEGPPWKPIPRRGHR